MGGRTGSRSGEWKVNEEGVRAGGRAGGGACGRKGVRAEGVRQACVRRAGRTGRAGELAGGRRIDDRESAN